MDDVNRTLSIVRRLAEGKVLNLPNGSRIGMTEDMSIGFIMENSEGAYMVAGLSTIDLKQLNALLNKHNIGMCI